MFETETIVYFILTDLYQKKSKTLVVKNLKTVFTRKKIENLIIYGPKGFIRLLSKKVVQIP